MGATNNGVLSRFAGFSPKNPLLHENPVVEAAFCVKRCGPLSNLDFVWNGSSGMAGYDNRGKLLTGGNHVRGKFRLRRASQRGY